MVKKMDRRPRGQGIAELSICLAVILAACLGMQTYIKRGLQGRYKDTVDNMTEQVPGAMPQYEPYYQNLDIFSYQQIYTNVTLSPGGVAGKNSPAGETWKASHISSYDGQ